MKLFSRKPDYSEFNLREPPQDPDLPLIWISDQGKPREPFRLHLPDVGEIWVVGWPAPAIPHFGLAEGISLDFNGLRIAWYTKTLVPEGVLDFWGCVGCISQVTLLREQEKSVASQIGDQIRTKMDLPLRKVQDISFARANEDPKFNEKILRHCVARQSPESLDLFPINFYPMHVH